MKFNIVLGNHPPTAINTTRDHTLIIRGGIEEAGHFAQLSFDQFYPKEINIFYDFIGPEQIPMFQTLKNSGHGYGLITTEILKNGEMNYADSPEIRARLEATKQVANHARFVWVMHEPSLSAYRDLCGHDRCYYLPLGYSPLVHELRFVPYKDRDIDFLFFGVPTQHRADIFEKLGKYGHNTQFVYNLPGFIRNSIIERSKINMSLRQTASWDQPSVGRLCYLLSNHCAIIAEQTANGRPYEDYVATSSPDRFVETCIEMISGDAYRDLAEQKAEQFRRDFPMKLFMEKLIEQTFAYA